MSALLVKQSNLILLPYEILIDIIIYLDANALKSLLYVCKFLRRFIFEQKYIFIRNFIKMYPYEILFWNNVQNNDDFVIGIFIQSFTLSNLFEHTCIRNEIKMLYSINNLREIKMLYIMIVHFNKINANYAAHHISKLNINGAYHYYIITSKYPDIIYKNLDNLELGHDIQWLVNNYEDMDEFYKKIDNAIDIGGIASDAFSTILLNDYNVYYNYLLFNIPSKDAAEFSYSGYDIFSEEILITYKALIPIIGKTYGVYFILEMNEMNMLEEEENIIHILSMLYRHNIENVKIANLIINDYSENFLQIVINMTCANRYELCTERC